MHGMFAVLQMQQTEKVGLKHVIAKLCHKNHVTCYVMLPCRRTTSGEFVADGSMFGPSPNSQAQALRYGIPLTVLGAGGILGENILGYGDESEVTSMSSIEIDVCCE